MSRFTKEEATAAYLAAQRLVTALPLRRRLVLIAPINRLKLFLADAFREAPRGCRKFRR